MIAYDTVVAHNWRVGRVHPPRACEVAVYMIELALLQVMSEQRQD